MIQLNMEDLDTTSTKLGSNAEQIRANVEKMSSLMATISDSWDDELAKKYIEKFEELKPTFDKFCESSKSASTFLTEVNKVYKSEYVDATRNSVSAQ